MYNFENIIKAKYNLKTFLIIILGFISSHLYSQRITCDNIYGYNFYQIYEELILDKKYNVEESTCFGKKFAQKDSLQGIKRVLLYHGPFTSNECEKCLYRECKFETYEFSPNDLEYENVEAFVNAYNHIMKSQLSKVQLIKINGFEHTTDLIFTSLLPFKNKKIVERINDTLINFKIYSDTLERLFHQDIEHLKVEIVYPVSDKKHLSFNYLDVKAKGIELNLNTLDKNVISVNFNFELMPNKYNICWCDILRKKYRMTIRLPEK